MEFKPSIPSFQVESLTHGQRGHFMCVESTFILKTMEEKELCIQCISLPLGGKFTPRGKYTTISAQSDYGLRYSHT